MMLTLHCQKCDRNVGKKASIGIMFCCLSNITYCLLVCCRLCLSFNGINTFLLKLKIQIGTQAAQTHYMNADVTIACERCCVTNGYLQRLVWDRSVFLKRDKKCYVFRLKSTYLIAIISPARVDSGPRSTNKQTR